jgi:hypothetical protein
MTTKPPSGLAASGSANEADSDITKEHTEDGVDVNVDPSDDVTVEATEDVTTEAVGETPAPSLRPGTVGVSPEQRAPTLLGVPINSLPLPGVTSKSVLVDEDATRTIDYNEEVTVLAQAETTDPLAALDEALARPSVTDDDEEETKVEPAETAMKAAASIDDVTTALSAQANLEREKALRRSLPPSSPSDDLEFADPEPEDEEESLDDELDDGDEVISAGGAIEEEADDLGDSEEDTTNGGVATSTFLKPADTTGLSGLLNPRRPPTGGRDGFGSRLPTPYPPPQSPIPGPSTSPFASRLGAAPAGSPYAGRATGTSMPAIQVPPPSGRATTESGEPGFFSKQVPMGFVFLIGAGTLLFGFGIRGFFSGGKGAPTPAVVATKPIAAPAAPAVVVVPVQGTPAAPAAATPPADTTVGTKPAAVPSTETPGAVQAGTTPSENPESADQGLWHPAAKKPAARPRKAATDAAEEALLKPKPAVAKETKPPAAPKEPKPAMTASAKPAKKPAKAWVDPFAN